MYGSPGQLVELSIDHPHLGENQLIDRLLAMPEVKAAYRSQVRRLAEEVFTPAKLGKDVEAVEGALKDLLVRDRKAAEARREGGSPFGPSGMGGPFGMASLPLKTFVEKRAASVRSQLAGTGKGYVP